MRDILGMIEETLGGQSMEESLEAIVQEHRERDFEDAQRRARTVAVLSGKPRVLLDGQIAWVVSEDKKGIGRYAVMTHNGGVREIVLPSSAPKPKRI